MTKHFTMRNRIKILDQFLSRTLTHSPHRIHSHVGATAVIFEAVCDRLLWIDPQLCMNAELENALVAWEDAWVPWHTRC